MILIKLRSVVPYAVPIRNTSAFSTPAYVLSSVTSIISLNGIQTFANYNIISNFSSMFLHQYLALYQNLTIFKLQIDYLVI